MGAFLFWTSVMAVTPLVIGIGQRAFELAFQMGRLH